MTDAAVSLESDPEKIRLEAQQRRIIREKEKIAARRENRATYDLPPGIRRKIKDIGDEERIPASQIVSLALARFIQEYQNGQVDLGLFKQPSRSPRYDWNLVLPKELIPAVRRKKKPVKK